MLSTLQQLLELPQLHQHHAGRHLLEQAAPSAPRVLGVGLGVFLLGFFL